MKNPSLKKVEKDIKLKLTDNVKFNEMLAPLYFTAMTVFLNYYYGLDYLKPLYGSASFYALLSTGLYIFVANYFQPDLDVRNSRPGMGHFPLGRWVGGLKFGQFLKWVVYPINRIWFHLWMPYSRLLTHRGAGHWPILSVWLRVWYLMFWVYLLEFALKIMYPEVNISFIKTILHAFFPWDKNFGNFYFLLFCFPIYLSDTVHIAVDYYDAYKRGMSFCPPKIPRGLIVKTINTIRGIR